MCDECIGLERQSWSSLLFTDTVGHGGHGPSDAQHDPLRLKASSASKCTTQLTKEAYSVNTGQ